MSSREGPKLLPSWAMSPRKCYTTLGHTWSNVSCNDLKQGGKKIGFCGHSCESVNIGNVSAGLNDFQANFWSSWQGSPGAVEGCALLFPSSSLVAAHALPALSRHRAERMLCVPSLCHGAQKISLGKRDTLDHVFWKFSSTGKDWCGRIAENLALLCLLAACQDKIKFRNRATYLKIFIIVREKHGYERGKDRVVMWAGRALVAPI